MAAARRHHDRQQQTAAAADGGYLFFSNVAAGETIRLQMPLVSNKLTLSGKLHIQPICVDLRGDSVATMENFGADLTYFDAV